MKTKFFCIFIIISILISYIFPIISSANYDKYVALGDSISQGFTMENGILDEDNYPEKLRKKLSISADDYNNLSIPAETAKIFYTTIQTSEYTNAIADADLITISIGSNEIVQIVFEAYSYATGIEMANDIAFYDALCEYLSNADLVTQVQVLLSLYEYFSTEDIDGKVANNILTYEEYWKKSVEYLKQINPYATIVVTEFYNPYYGVTLLNYDFSGWVDDIIQKMNTILHDCSNSETEYKIAKIYSTFNSTNPRLTYANPSLTNFNIDPHPTVLGHEMISLKILETLASSSDSQKSKDISLLSINSIEDQEHTGEAIEPEIIIKDGNSILVEDEDYILVYHNNIDVGEASAIIVGTGNYSGKVTKTFNIKSAPRKNISACQINSLEAQLYLGMNLEPDVIIFDGTKLLIKDQDYNLKYSNNLNTGIATITITGIGNYEGTTSTNFLIIPNTISLTTVHDIPDQLYTGNEITPNVVVTYGSAKLVKGTDYTVSYEDNINEGTATITINGTGNFIGTVTKEFNILNDITTQLKDISQASVSEISEKTYSGSSITPEVLVTFEGEELTKNTDFKIFYNNNINVGTALITIVGIGEYTGIIEKEFKITQKSIENLGVDDIPDQEYTGKSIEPEIVLSDNYTKLKENTDYTVKYLYNIEIGLAAAQIYGKGNYTGTIIKTFNIVEPIQNEEPPKDEEPPKEETPPPENPSDPTISDKDLPNAGASLKFIITILFFSSLAVISYRLYKKW